MHIRRQFRRSGQPARQLRSELLAMVKDGLLLPFGLRGGRQYELTNKR